MAERKSWSPASRSRNLQRMALDISPVSDGWAIRSDGASRATSVHRTKREAVEAARILMQNKGGALRIHGRDGRISESVTLGRQAAARISAVEGISLDGEVRQDLEGFDSLGLSPEQRRIRIGLKYAAGAKGGR